jgi:hypothetical protein
MSSPAPAAETPRYELDVLHPEHIPAPPIPNWFAEELAQLLPRNPFGEPQLRAVWGMDARCFRNGDPEAIKYIAYYQLIRNRKWRRLDPIAGAYEYFDTREEAAKALNPRLAPVFEYRVTREVKIWGPPRWHIEQWFPPERIDTPQNWEHNRIGRYRNRKGEQITFDALGPHPSRGQYRECLVVEGSNGEYRELDRLLMTELRQMVHARQIYSYNDHTNAQEVRDVVADLRAQEAASQRRIEEEFEDYVGPSGYRLIEGNAFSGFGGTVASQSRALKKKKKKK